MLAVHEFRVFPMQALVSVSLEASPFPYVIVVGQAPDVRTTPVSCMSGVELRRLGAQREPFCLHLSALSSDRTFWCQPVAEQGGEERWHDRLLPMAADVPCSQDAAEVERILMHLQPQVDPIPEIVSSCRHRNTQFLDPVFLPIRESFGVSGAVPYDQWLRIPAFLSFPLLFASTGPPVCESHVAESPTHSWLCDALRAVAEHVGCDLVQHIRPATLSAWGIFAVKVWVDGEWQFVILDDYIPLDKSSRPLVMEVSNLPSGEDVVWPLILVKALSKLCGSYQSLLEVSVPALDDGKSLSQRRVHWVLQFFTPPKQEEFPPDEKT